MGKPVAKQDDHVVGIDTHIVIVSDVPTPIPHVFEGPLQESLSSTVHVDHKPVALVGSVANNTPQHIPMGGSFKSPPSNRGTVKDGSATIIVDGKKLARADDPVTCCNDPTDTESGHIVASSTVIAG